MSSLEINNAPPDDLVPLGGRRAADAVVNKYKSP